MTPKSDSRGKASAARGKGTASRGKATASRGTRTASRATGSASRAKGTASRGAGGSGAPQPAYLEELRALVELVNESGISELEVQSDGRTFRIGRSNQAYGGSPGPPASAPAPGGGAPAAASGPVPSASHVPIKSPIVGTFYRAPAPDADSYVEEGVRVSIGQTVCIVEAMKLMNEIQSEVAGRIVRICVQNAQPVEYGQELFWVDPEG